jgi:Na+-translocating ferredoxin:NAD+ oxidoreductase RnfC subunit
MRTLGFTLAGKENWNQSAELCCACGLCTLYACPEDLYPKEACDAAKADMKAAGVKFVQERPVRVHPMKEMRRVPLQMLRKRLKVDEYESETPFDAVDWKPKKVRLLLSQHVGKPASPVVEEGAAVSKGSVVAKVGEKDLGVSIHASIGGRVIAVTDQYIEVEA